MDMEQEDDNWMPLESNPQVMNEQAIKLGINTDIAQFHDLLGFEDWAFEMIPQPIYGVLFNFPIKENTNQLVDQETVQIQEKGQHVSPNLFYMKQLAKNACGTIAMVHAALNADNAIIQEGSYLAEFKKQIQGKTPQQIGEAFKKAKELKEVHKEAVEQGESACCDEIDRHFIAFVLKEGDIYELDGCKQFPINHGKSTPETFLPDVSKVIQKFFERDPNEVSFSTVVLAKAAQE